MSLCVVGEGQRVGEAGEGRQRTPGLEVVTLHHEHAQCVHFVEAIHDAQQVARVALGQHGQHVAQGGLEQVAQLLLRRQLEERRPVRIRAAVGRAGGIDGLKKIHRDEALGRCRVRRGCSG